MDELSEIASLICDVPISLITFIDEDRLWFKVHKGLDINENKREGSFCQHALNKPKEIFVVEDALIDPLFKNNALVNGYPNIRFYAGAPLETPNGNILGTLCIIDNKPRKISDNQKKALQILAKKAMDYLNVRKILLEQKNEIQTNAVRLKKLTDKVPGGIFQLKMSIEGVLTFDFVSEGMLILHPSVSMEQWLKSPEIGFTLIHPEDLDNFKNQLLASFKNLSLLYIEYRVKAGSEYGWHSINGNPEKLTDGSVVWYGSFHNINNRIEYEKAMEQIAFDISHVLRRPVATLLGLNHLIENEKNIKRSKLIEYVGHIKTVSKEMETFIHSLNDIYQKKKEIITGKTNGNKT